MSVQINQANRSNEINKILKTLSTGKSAKTQKALAPEMTKNGSIFNLVSNNQTKANGAQPAMRKPASPAAARSQLQTTNGVVTANTKASVENVQGTKSKTSTPTVKEIKSGAVPDEFQKVEIGDVDFSNLGSYSNAQLKSIKHDLQEILDKDYPSFILAPYKDKMGKVDSELKTRGEQDGNRVDENDKKDNGANIGDASSGASAAKAGTAEARRGTAELNNMSSRSTEIGKDVKSAQSKLEKQQAKGQKEVKQNAAKALKEQENIERLNAENDNLNTEIEDANSEMETIAAEVESQGAGARTRGAVSAASSESISSAGGGETGVSVDTGKVESLQAKVQTASAKMAVNSVRIGKSTVAIKKYQTANNKTIRTLTKANKAYTRTVTQAQQQLQANEAKESSFENTMNKINDVSSKVALIGSATKYTGLALMACKFTAVVGAKMYGVGKMTETAGNVGVAAANVGLAASNIAKGNILGGLMNVGAAIMAGKTAADGIKGMAAKDGIKNMFKVMGKEAIKTELKSNIMNIASAVMNAATVFAKKDDGADTQATQKPTGTARVNRGFNRRRIA